MKLFTLARLMVVIAIMSLAAQLQAAQVFLDAQAPYSDSNPQWKVWAWADGQNGYWVQGNDIVVLSNGLIEATVNEDNFQFVRCSSDGNTEWNRTVNLRTVADATYTITGWGSGGGMTVDVTNPTYNTVTLDLSKVSETDKVWYAWAFATGGNGSWVAGTQSGNDIEFNIASLKDKVIFVRMNPNGAPSWDSSVKLNQTDDLTLQPDGTYVITNLESTNMTGYWKTSVWHQDPNGDPDSYLGNRRALVGRHCMVNKLVNVVGVGSWINDLNNLVDEDLSNYATFPKIADVGVGVNPVTSVRDTKNHYAAGTTAGFNVVMAADASLLGLDLANCFAISFFLEGELQQTVAVDAGQAFGGIGLSLITLPGSDEVSLDISATAPCEFDEIALMPAGVQADVASAASIRYAFVGDLIKHTITQTSMENYAEDHGRLPFTLDQGVIPRDGRENGIILVGYGYWAGSDLINDDLTDGVAWGVLSVGTAMDARIGAAMNRQDPDQSQPFKAGSTVGFSYGNGSLLNLPLGDAIRIRLYEGHWVEKSAPIIGTYYEYEETEVQDESVKINVLSLKLIHGGDYQVTITADHDFSHARISFPTGLNLNLGGTKVKYAFICDPVEGYHKCNLGVSANVALCADDTQYQLSANGGVPVTWTLADAPAGSTATVDAQTGLLTGIDVEGEYRVRATAADGCYDEIVVKSGLDFDTRCDMPISNGDEPEYALSEELPGADGALININGYLLNKENVLNANYNDYATFNSVLDLTLAENLPIVGVKKLNGNISTGAKRRVGFVVETKSTGLSADAADLFNIRCYKNGVRTYWHVIDETNVVKAKVIGSDKVQKLRYSIEVPADVEFDEFALWKSGVLDVELERFKVYYAFDEDAEGLDAPDDCADPLGCAGKMVSIYDNATLNSNEIQFAGAINAANVVDNLSFLVDDDLNTGVSVTNTVSAGNGIVFAVDLGRVYSPRHQIGIVLDSKTYLANAKVGNWLTIKTYRNGVRMDSISDWGVIGVNVIGYGDKSYLYLTPTMPYDEVRITVAALVNALDFDTKYFGIFVRSDYDGDGTPDCQDDYICPNPLGVDVRYESEFDAVNERNLYKNTVKVYNLPDSPVMVEQLTEGSEIRVYRVDNDALVGTATVTGVTTNQDGSYSIAYSNTPNSSSQDHVDANRYPDATGTLTADELGYVNFEDLFILDQFSAPTSNNGHSTDYHYKAILINNLRSQRTESQVMEVPVLKTAHVANAATFTLEDVQSDTDHHLANAPVDIYVQMKNDLDIQRYEAIRVANNAAETVAAATRVDDLTFARTSKQEDGQMKNWGTVVFSNVDDVLQTVVLRDSTMQSLAEYVPTIFAYTPSYDKVNKDQIVLSSYGADRLTDDIAHLNMTVMAVEKSEPYNGYRSYTADISLNGQVPNDMEQYYYRIWRVMPDGSEVLLNTLESQSGGTGESAWAQSYEALKDTYPGATISVRDIFAAPSIGEGESLTISYIARLYAEKELPSLQLRNRAGGSGYGIAPAGGSGEWNDGTPTGVNEMTSALVPMKTTYYNALGMSSSTPFDGLNIIVIQYTNGKTVVQKHTY